MTVWLDPKTAASLGEPRMTTRTNTPSDERVETVARALCNASGQMWREKTECPSLGLPHDFDFDGLNNHWRHKARAALSASGIERIQEEARKYREALEAIREKASGAGYDPMQAVSEIDDIARATLSADMEKINEQQT